MVPWMTCQCGDLMQKAKDVGYLLVHVSKKKIPMGLPLQSIPVCWNIFSEIPHRNSSSPWFPFLFNCHCSLFHRKNNARFSIVFLKINKEKNIQSLIQHSFIDFLVSWLQFHGWSCNLQVRGDQNIPRYAGSLFLLPGHG